MILAGRGVYLAVLAQLRAEPGHLDDALLVDLALGEPRGELTLLTRRVRLVRGEGRGVSN
jgi:hypothetical protein